jgi:hypothetical protein
MLRLLCRSLHVFMMNTLCMLTASPWHPDGNHDKTVPATTQPRVDDADSSQLSAKASKAPRLSRHETDRLKDAILLWLRPIAPSTLPAIADVRALVRAYPELHHLESLELFSLNLNDQDIHELIKLFPHCPNLKELWLSHNKITELGAKTLAKSLKTALPRMQSLKLDSNKIPYDGLRELIETVRNRPTYAHNADFTLWLQKQEPLKEHERTWLDHYASVQLADPWQLMIW